MGTTVYLRKGEQTAVNLPTTMRALQQMSLKGPHDMHLMTDAPVPVPGPGQILIRVAAAGVNFADVSRAQGTFLNGPQPPYVAGFEAAGEVVATGDGVTSVRPGTRVAGVGPGAFAEYMVLPAASGVPVPAGWTAQQALGLMVNWPAALAAVKLGRLAPGETVLIHAAAGATGQAAIRVARHHGATVVATASPGKHDLVRALGVEHVLDACGADLVLESAGGATFGASLAATRRVTGRVVVLGLSGGEAALTNWDLVYRHQVQLIGLNLGALIQFTPQLFGEVMRELFALIAAGVLKPIEPTTFDLASGAKVLAALEARATTGKLALLP